MDKATLNIIKLSISLTTGEMTISGYFFYILIFFIIIIIVKQLFFTKKYKKKSQAFEFCLAGQKYSYTLERDYTNVEIAHRIYIELITRKAAIPFDEENDIIVEVYKSWYNLFGIIREEIKGINGNTLLDDNNSLPLIELTTAILNNALRPHLTKHQGRFRKWFETSNKGNEAPQSIQKKYPDFDNLVTDLKAVNSILVEYANQLKTFIYN